MRRADRLFQIILYLRRRRFATARDLAQALEVSERTIYRDINELTCCGIPIDGEAGVGYRLRHDFDLPPLMFDREELEALRLGARMVKTWADPDLARSASYALAKIEAVLPADMLHNPSAIYAPRYDPYPVQLVGQLRHAINDLCKVHFHYARADGGQSERTVKPLGLFYWGRVWTLVAWCELRNGFRHFRLDRMSELTTTEKFVEQQGQSLMDFFSIININKNKID